MRHLILSIILNFAFFASAIDSLLYRETYRPQYHFTPAHRWIGDPCGTIKHNCKYIAYSWGGAESTDLVHWTEITDHAIKDIPAGISTFTGSVVVDKDNTASYGNNGRMVINLCKRNKKCTFAEWKNCNGKEPIYRVGRMSSTRRDCRLF